MATTLNYSTQPISTRVDPRGRYYARIEAPALTAEESLRDIMAYKKINAYSASTVLQLLNDLLQGAVELTALDGRTRVLGQMLRVYMALEGSFESPILSPSDKANLKVRTQLLKDMKYPVDGANFTLTAKDTYPRISGVHYSGQTTTEDALRIGTTGIIVGVNFNAIDWENDGGFVAVFNPTNNLEHIFPLNDSAFSPSENAIYLQSFTNTITGSTETPLFTGDGPWDATIRLYRFADVEEQTGETVMADRSIKVYAA